MSIRIDDKKPDFDIAEWEVFFESKGYSIPNNEMEFRQTMMNKNLTIRYISDAIKEKAKWDDDTLDEECPDKISKIDKFLELYHVIYPEASVMEIPNMSETLPPSTMTATVVELDAESISLDDAQDFLDENHSKLKKDVDGKISVKAPVLYENMPITVNSNFRVKCTVKDISRNNVLIIDGKLEKVLAVGKIVNQEGNDIIIIERENIVFSSFAKETQFHIAVLKVHDEILTGDILYKPIQIQMHIMETTDHILCIDFGTSNTTAGSYRIEDAFGLEPELVTFSDVTRENRLVNYYPTVVYVENCENENNIIYKFGFEAKKLEKTGNYESSASVFYQIKHWLIEDSYYDEKISLCDMKGRIATVSKKDVVCAYLKHIIDLSQDYFGVKFKELHFTAPAKMKHKFISILKNILKEYTIVEDGIDEAGAILFDYVANKFSKWQNEKDKENSSGNVAVIDCGGGTTDLATCKYEFSEEDHNAHINQIKMSTKFTNGDFNYGGNNITYRIMQLIKLKIAVKYGFISSDEYNKVLERSENDILLDADKEDYNGDMLYKDFIGLYGRCEEFIPTQYNNMSDDFFDDDMPRIKRNFYYLWHFAEQVKIIFYREEKEVKKDKWEDAIQAIGALELNYLYKKEKDSLVRLESPLNDLEITITEIRKVIFGDIYNLLNKILPLENGLPNSIYDYYRLSGQSCKINLFNELLKEFIPGKSLRAKMERNIEHIESISLKKHCIDGSIRYMMYKRLNMRVKLISDSALAERIYRVSFADLVGEVPAEDRETHALKLYPIKSELDEVTVVVRDQNKVIRRVNLSVKIKGQVNKCANPEQVIEILKNGNKSVEWDANATYTKLANFRPENGDAEVVFIVAVPSGRSDGYGFYIHFIKKIIEETKEKYKVTDGKYYNYEATNSGFFNGLR